jgi:aspartate 1-decarboxylase
MDAARILSNQELHVWNVTRGTRLVTYAIEGPRGSGVICINGAAAHGNKPGDLVILATFADMSVEEARTHTPTVVRVDEANTILDIRAEIPGPADPALARMAS